MKSSIKSGIVIVFQPVTSQTEIVPGPTAEELDQAVPWDAPDIVMMAEMLEGSSATVGAAQPEEEDDDEHDDEHDIMSKDVAMLQNRAYKMILNLM